MNRPFIKGLDLSQRFYEQAVKPILRQHFPNLCYAAALIGRGSEVLEFDTPQSQDHDWGPRLMLFLTETDYQNDRKKIDQRLRQKLPPEIEGYPTNFAGSSDGTISMATSETGEINHGVTFFTVHGFCCYVLNVDLGGGLNATDWLTIPEQVLRAVTSGRVFYDGFGQLEALRAELRHYPHDVWLYQLAAQWTRISQEEAFMGRCGQVGDELGSRLIAGRLIRDLMRLCFLMERQHAPYVKWFSKAFAQLDCAAKLMPIFNDILDATQWQRREKALTQAYSIVAMMHNTLGITPPLPTEVSAFHDRPFLVIHAENFAVAIYESITSEEVLSLPRNLGAVDQFVDSTDVLDYPRRYGQLKVMYQGETT